MKAYIPPYMEVLHAEAAEMMAISIIQGGTADDSEVLTRENTDWDIWAE